MSSNSTHVRNNLMNNPELLILGSTQLVYNHTLEKDLKSKRDVYVLSLPRQRED